MTTNQLIEKHISLADQIASNKKKNLPRSIQLDELKSAAYLGLVDAAHKYNVERCDTFECYACIRIKGAINDYLRELSWGTRSSPCLYAPLEYEPPAPAQPSGDLFAKVGQGLTEQRRAVLKSYYQDEKTQEQIGVEMGVSKSRICQILADACDQIRATWGREELWGEVA